MYVATNQRVLCIVIFFWHFNIFWFLCSCKTSTTIIDIKNVEYEIRMQKKNWNQIRECGTYTMSWSGVVELSRRRYLWFSNPILCVIRSKSVAYLDRRYECLKSALWLNKSLNVVSTPFCLYEKNRWVEFNLFCFILFALNFFYTTGWGIVVAYLISRMGCIFFLLSHMP